MSELDDFAEKYFSEYKGKSVPLDLLLAWLSENHDHREDGTAIVPSMDLHRWAQKNAVTRVVDREPIGDERDILRLFEHGWHKAGAACEGHLTQSRARIGDPVPEGTVVITGTFPESLDEQIRKGFVGGISIHE